MKRIQGEMDQLFARLIAESRLLLNNTTYSDGEALGLTHDHEALESVLEAIEAERGQMISKVTVQAFENGNPVGEWVATSKSKTVQEMVDWMFSNSKSGIGLRFLDESGVVFPTICRDLEVK